MTDQERSSDAYRRAGVDYETLDAGKRLAMASALATSHLLGARGGRSLDRSRGEPAFVFELGQQTLALVLEGLGTKSIIARQVEEQLGINRFAEVGYDTVAAILNDLSCVGALPLVVNAYFATGSSGWYREPDRLAALLEGWQGACFDAGCVWGGGESPSLTGLVDGREIELAGCAVGALAPGRRPILGEELRPGDEIVLLASSGLHANGASLARAIAERLPDGYATVLPAGETFGEALLAPSLMYVPLVEALLERAVPLTYMSHITGHGLLKLMRAEQPLTYRITALPPCPPVLKLLAAEAGMDAAEAHRTLNMGSGYALYCSAGAGPEIVELAEQMGLRALLAGRVEEGPRRVILEPIDVVYEGHELEFSPG
jgi:phosphoribosylformylglycinamidine cyclo-ligase